MQHRNGTRRPGARARTINVHRLSQRTRAESRRETAEDLAAVGPVERPKTWGECREQGLGTQHRCPWVSCAYNLYLDVNARNGNIKLNFPDLNVWELRESCSLAVAERSNDEVALETVGDLLNLTRERVRQLERLTFDQVRELLRQIDDAPFETGR